MPKIKVLVCESDYMVTKTVEYYLVLAGYDVEKAPDGRKALEMINSQAPDILITELLLPFISGLELIQMVRSRFHRSIGIVVLTAMNNANTIRLSGQIGADRYIKKPFDPDKLIHLIQHVSLEKKNSLLGRLSSSQAVY
jgi:DNA-binding response OmpR family regulator